MFSYGVYSASNIASEACEEVVLDGCLFEGLPLMGLVSAIFTSLFIGSEYSDGTIRNKLVVGHSRMRIYLANLIVCSIASILISLAYTAGVFVIGNMKGGEFINRNRCNYHVYDMRSFDFCDLYKHYDLACYLKHQ